MVVDVFQHGHVTYEFILDPNLLLWVIHDSINKHQCPVVSGNLINCVGGVFVELAEDVLDLDLVSMKSLHMTWVVIVYHGLLSTLCEHIVHIKGGLIAFFNYGGAFTEN